MASASLKCHKCGDIIKSTHVHDFKWCSCRNIFVDGGDEYLRLGGKGLEDYPVSFSLIDPDGTEREWDDWRAK